MSVIMRSHSINFGPKLGVSQISIYSEWVGKSVRDRWECLCGRTTANENFKLNYLHNQSRYNLRNNFEEQMAS